MQIFIKTISGETIALVDVDNTVSKVKEKIEELEGIPQESQRLIYSGRELEDSRSLEYYNVQDQSTVHMTMDLPGGFVYGPLRRLAEFHLNKKICRKCNGRLPPSAIRCRKAKCGKTYDIRDKKMLWRNTRVIKKLSDWEAK